MMRHTRITITAFSLALGACVERPFIDEVGGSDDGTTGDTPGGGSSGTPTTSGAVPVTSSSGDAPDITTTTGGGSTTSAGSTSEAGDTAESCGFLCESSGGDETVECDMFAQDCPEGQKCAAYGEDGTNSWNATKCVPVSGDGQPGEPCTAVGGGLSGVDDCEKGAMCWNVDAMDHGICVGLCLGNRATPECASDKFHCDIHDDSVLNLCFPICDPLVQDCPGDDLCVPSGDTFSCVLDASGAAGAAFDPCEFANACDQGLMCLDPTLGAECDPNAGGCCLPFCPLDDPNFPCPGVGQQCISLYGPMPPPEDFANVGICILPP